MSEHKEKYQPKTVEEAVEILMSILSEKDKQTVKDTPKEKLVIFLGLSLE